MDPATINISFMIAFSAGSLSFISPCVLPLVPSYVSNITGLSLDDLSVSKDLDAVQLLAFTFHGIPQRPLQNIKPG